MGADSWVKLTEYGSAVSTHLSKEDERSAALARRAQHGDYDEGEKFLRLQFWLVSVSC